MDQPDHLLQDGRVRLGQHPVAQVEHVAGRGPGPFEDVPGLFGHDVPVRQAQRRVEVALDRDTGPHPSTGHVEWHPPVDADDVAPCGGHRRQQLAGAHPEEDGGDAGMGVRQLGKQPAGGR